MAATSLFRSSHSDISLAMAQRLGDLLFFLHLAGSARSLIALLVRSFSPSVSDFLDLSIPVRALPAVPLWSVALRDGWAACFTMCLLWLPACRTRIDDGCWVVGGWVQRGDLGSRCS